MALPNFLIVGTAKAGTTSLFEYLGQHPDVFVPPVKEPCFFSSGLPSFTHNRTDYENLFAGRTSEKAIGEASTPYIYDPDAAGRIRCLLPDAKIIILLRNPVHRAYSEWMFNAFELGCEPLLFEQALDAEDERAGAAAFRERCTTVHYSSFLYFRAGLYHDQVKRYLDLFGRRQVRVYLFEEFVRDPGAVCRDAFDFLGVNPSFLPTFEAHNVSKRAHSLLLQHLLVQPPGFLFRLYAGLPWRLRVLVHRGARRLFAANLSPWARPQINPKTATALAGRYEASIGPLERLLGRDLSIWKTPDTCARRRLLP